MKMDSERDRKREFEEKIMRAKFGDSILESSVKRGYNPLVIITAPVKYLGRIVSNLYEKFFKPYEYHK